MSKVAAILIIPSKSKVSQSTSEIVKQKKLSGKI